jgi:hypothetical protein
VPAEFPENEDDPIRQIGDELLRARNPFNRTFERDVCFQPSLLSCRAGGKRPGKPLATGGIIPSEA